MFFLKVPDQFGEEPHVVDGHIGLKGVTHVPARLAAAVAFALRVADGKTVAVGNAVHVEPFRVALSSVAVEDNDQRRAVGQRVGQLQLGKGDAFHAAHHNPDRTVRELQFLDHPRQHTDHGAAFFGVSEDLQ